MPVNASRLRISASIITHSNGYFKEKAHGHRPRAFFDLLFLSGVFNSAYFRIVFGALGERRNRMLFIFNTVILTEFGNGKIDDRMGPHRLNIAVDRFILGEITEAVGHGGKLVEAFLYRRQAHALKHVADILFLGTEFKKLGEGAAFGKELLPYFSFVLL